MTYGEAIVIEKMNVNLKREYFSLRRVYENDKRMSKKDTVKYYTIKLRKVFNAINSTK